jgi:RNA polymerase sigma factor (sigma-70 family)
MDNINLIRKIAWSFHHSTGLDWDELFQEAALAYYSALRRYNLQHNGIMRRRLKSMRTTTFLYNCMRQHMINYLRREQRKWNGNIVPLKEAAGITTKENDFMEQLSRDAQQIVDVALHSFRTFDVTDSKQARNRLAQQMIVLRGWSWKRIWCAMRDIKLALK